MDTTEDLPRFGYISCAAISDVGRKRKNNEDSHGEWPDQGVFCVADGMGGARDGEVASRIVVEHLSIALRNWGRHSPPIALGDRLALMDRILDSASKWIFDYAETHDAKGCGTTFVGVVFDPADATAAVALHAGDSRLYRIRGRRIEQITRDHSVANMAGVKNEAELDPAFRNMILRAVGINERVELERTPFDVREGDWIVICSDGLSKMMDDATIAKIVRSAKEGREAAQDLVDEANRRGGRDNVTVVALSIGALPGAGNVHAALDEAEIASLLVGQEEEPSPSTESEFTIPTTVTDGGGEVPKAGKKEDGGGNWLADEDSDEIDVARNEQGCGTMTSGAGAKDDAAETVETKSEKPQDTAPSVRAAAAPVRQAAVRIHEKPEFYRRPWFRNGLCGVAAVFLGVGIAMVSRDARRDDRIDMTRAVASDYDNGVLETPATPELDAGKGETEAAEEKAARKAEEERIAREEAVRKAREAEEARIAAEKKAEAERIAAARKAEAERKAREEAERIAAARKAEEERIAREEAARKEREAEEARIAAARKAEAERKAREAEEARIAAEKKAEEERLAREEAERKAREEEQKRITSAIADTAKFVRRRHLEVTEKQETLSQRYVEVLLKHVMGSGDNYIKASKYPERFKEELSMFRWALEYVLATAPMEPSVQKKLELWERELEGGVK